MSNRIQISALAMVLSLTSVAFAGLNLKPAATPQEKLMAKRAAELDAYRQMAEYVVGLQLTSTTTVRDFVTESDQIATSVKTFLRGARVTATRFCDDDTVEVDMALTLKSLVTHLKKVHAESYHGNRFTTSDFEKIKTVERRNVIEVTGFGATRSARKDDPFVALDGPQSRTVRLDLPTAWDNVSPQNRLMARRAALADGYRKLAERIYGLSIESNTTVRDFVTENDEIHTAVDAFLRGARVIETRYTEAGFVEVDMAVTLEQLITTLKTFQSERRRGGRVTRTHIDHLRQTVKRSVISVTGTGAPGDPRSDDASLNQEVTRPNPDDAETTIIIHESEPVIVIE